MLLCKCKNAHPPNKQTLSILNISLTHLVQFPFFNHLVLKIIQLRKVILCIRHFHFSFFSSIIFDLTKSSSIIFQINRQVFDYMFYIHTDQKNSLNFELLHEWKENQKKSSIEKRSDLIFQIIPFVFSPWIIFFIFQ